MRKQKFDWAAHTLSWNFQNGDLSNFRRSQSYHCTEDHAESGASFQNQAGTSLQVGYAAFGNENRS